MRNFLFSLAVASAWNFSASSVVLAQADMDDAMDAMDDMADAKDLCDTQKFAMDTNQMAASQYKLDAHGDYVICKALHGTNGSVEQYLDLGDQVYAQANIDANGCNTYYTTAEAKAESADTKFQSEDWDGVVADATSAAFYFHLAKPECNLAGTGYQASVGLYSNAQNIMNSHE